MANKFITPEGKTKMLQYALGGDDGFRYLALGGEGSSASDGTGTDAFIELTGNGYKRVILEQQDNDETTQSITLTATFEDTNYNPSNGGMITEIGIVNNPVENQQQDTFFAFAQVPEILKSDNISLKYTIVISVL